MSFYGKRYRRVGHENVEELLAATKDNEQLAAIINAKPPTVCFTRHHDTVRLILETGDRTLSYDFVLGLEKEIQKHDGSVIKIIFTEYSENILDQYILMPKGRSAFFRRIFGDRDCKLIISMPAETSITATIYFEEVD